MLLLAEHHVKQLLKKPIIIHSYQFPNVVNGQVDDDGSLSRPLVHTWNKFICSDITSITSDNSLAHLMYHVIYVTSLIRAIILDT